MKRWHEDKNAMKRQKKIWSEVHDYWNKNSEKIENEKNFDSLGMFRKKHAMDCGKPGCLLCHFDKIFKIKSKKDIIADLKTKEELGDI
jgi:predicted metalloprotease